jgi:outer membrane protein assembly factor BamD (BamD/ComL family)
LETRTGEDLEVQADSKGKTEDKTRQKMKKRLGLRQMLFATASTLMILATMSSCGSKAKELRLEGIAQLEKGDYQDAITTLNKALDESNGQISRVQFDILLYRAEAEYMTGDLAAAQKTVNILTKIDGKNETYQKLQTQIDAKKLIQDAATALNEEDLETARANLDKARDAGLQNDRDLLFNEAVYLEKTAQWQSAYDAFNDYLGMYPGDEEAKRELNFLKTRVDALKHNALLSGGKADTSESSQAADGQAGSSGTGSSSTEETSAAAKTAF